MAGVYGEQLAYFPELLSDYTIFTMKALPGGGWSPREEFMVVTGYLTRTVLGDAGDPDENFLENQRASFYCYDEVPRSAIRQGMYVESDQEIYKFIQDNNYSKEGGFTVHKLQIVTGVTDQQVQNDMVEEALLGGF